MLRKLRLKQKNDFLIKKHVIQTEILEVFDKGSWQVNYFGQEN